VADQIAEGGAVIHNHIQALTDNADALKKSRVKTIWILVRDPRDAVCPLQKMNKIYTNAFDDADHRRDDRNDMLERQFISACRNFSQWVSDWITVSKCPDLPFGVFLLTFDEVAEKSWSRIPNNVRSALGLWK